MDRNTTKIELSVTGLLAEIRTEHLRIISLERYRYCGLPDIIIIIISHRLCGLVVIVPGYRSGCPGSIPGKKKTVVGLEQGPLSLVSTTEELLDRKVATPV
jgi:hypothetical protein